jgi:hypothetical protein
MRGTSIAFELEEFGVLAAMTGQATRALRLAGAAAALRELHGMPLTPVVRSRLDLALSLARQALDTDAREAAWVDGRAMSREQAVAYALSPPARERERLVSRST